MVPGIWTCVYIGIKSDLLVVLTIVEDYFVAKWFSSLNLWDICVSFYVFCIPTSSAIAVGVLDIAPQPVILV